MNSPCLTCNQTLPSQVNLTYYFANGLIYCWNRTNNQSYSRTEDEFSFSLYISNECACPALRADPDIAGQGVIAAFLATAALTLLATIVWLLLSRTSGYYTVDGEKVVSLNPIDRFFRAHVCERVQSYVQDPALYADYAYALVQSASDTQLVAGIAILLAVFKGVVDETITVYHFNMAADLAWMSSNTHLMAASVLEPQEGRLTSPEIAKEAPASSPSLETGPDCRARRVRCRMRLPIAVRAALMLFLAALLVWACWIAGYKGWDKELRCPVAYTTGRPKGGEPKAGMIANIVLIVYAYSARFLGLSLRVRDWWKTHIRTRLVGDWKSIQGARSWARFAWVSVWSLVASELWDILELTAWFILGVYWTVTDRMRGHKSMTKEEAQKEDGIGFGQFVPLLLLLLPVLQLIDTYSTARENDHTSHDDGSTEVRRQPSRNTAFASSINIHLNDSPAS